MTQFNIHNIIEEYNLDTDELSKALFPNAKYPKPAFNRVLAGESSLSVEQLEKLASFIGVVPAELFSLDTWRSSTADGYLSFKKGEFEVKLNYNGAFLTLYKNNEVIDRRIIGNSMSIDEFTKHINDLITKFQ